MDLQDFKPVSNGPKWHTKSSATVQMFADKGLWLSNFGGFEWVFTKNLGWCWEKYDFLDIGYVQSEDFEGIVAMGFLKWLAQEVESVVNLR